MRKLPLIGEALNLTRFFARVWYIYFPCAIVSLFIWPAMSYLEGYLLGGMMESAMVSDIAPVIARLPLLLIGVIAAALAQAFSAYGKDIAMERATMNLRETLLGHILKLPYSTLQRTHSGNYLSQFTVDSGGAMQACDQLYNMAGTVFLSNIAQVSYIFYCSPVLGWTAIGVAVMSLLFNGGFAPYLRKLNIIQRARTAEMSERLSDMLGGHTVLRTDNKANFFIERTMNAVENLFGINWRIKKISTFTSTPAELSRFLIDGIIMAVAILLFANGKLTPNQVMTCWTIGSGIGFSMRRIGQGYMRIQAQLASADRVCALLNEREEDEGHETAPLTHDPAVSFRDVGFAYREDAMLFDHLNAEFRAGQSAALVGSSGGGKSTLALMILRFIDPAQGIVEVFGRGAKSYTLKALRSLSAYVPQNPHLFDGSIWENIQMGRTNAKDDEIYEAARLARVDAFADLLPEGLHTRVGERGAQLSGGQRQRVAIARALLKRAPILILDEATASLDNSFEQDIHSALAALPDDQTVVTIVHRLSTATDNDIIHVLEGGKLQESGNHDALMEANGRYRQLWMANQSKAMV